MTEWTVVGVIIAVVGLVASVARPMLHLNASITRLTTLLDSLRRELAEFNEKNTKGHDRLWKKLEEQNNHLSNHEHRLTVLEERENREERI